VALAILYFLGSTHLSNRHLFVSVLDSSSAAFVPSPGLPQGAVISPLLFSLFINSAPSVLRHAKPSCLQMILS